MKQEIPGTQLQWNLFPKNAVVLKILEKRHSSKEDGDMLYTELVGLRT